MDEHPTGIRLAGVGGQGIVLAGLLLGHAAVREGLYAAGSNSYGSQSRGSLCTAEVVIARSPIDYPRVELANLLIAMSPEGYDAYAGKMALNSRILYDAGAVSRLRGEHDEQGFGVVAAASKELNDVQTANVIWTGILASTTGWLGRESLEEAICAHVPAPLIGINIKALRLGIEIGAGISTGRQNFAT